jgi:peptidoglycan hydrolase-like protein with peptidoglycan-binding domain
MVVAVALIALILGVGFVGARGGSADSAGNPSSSQVASGAVLGAIAPTESTTTVAQVASAAVDESELLPPVSRTLQQGLAGDDVKMLQDRLAGLGFDPGPVDGIFGKLTTQAVWAFEKLVLGTPRSEATGNITPEAWETLRSELTISPRRSTNGQADHTEVYLPEQVLIVFHQDKPALISHISTGELDADGKPAEYCETATYDTDAQGRELEEPVTKQVCALAKTPGGVFTYKRQVEGKRVSPLGGMWNPVYFNYGIAVHGAENVPLEPASHGCVRLPMHISEYFQSTISLGDRILVWNGETEPEQVSERGALPSFDYADPNATTTTTSTTTTTTVPAPTTTKPAPTTTTTTKPTTTTTVPVPTTTTIADAGAGADSGDGDT